MGNLCFSKNPWDAVGMVVPCERIPDEVPAEEVSSTREVRDVYPEPLREQPEGRPERPRSPESGES